ncbi:T9SS type A sorting domain-containing protein [candidate division KSB1 bacterium]|nr:T9SS type A sorting domain-containing protein [candidate division KSB1 bacterium]
MMKIVYSVVCCVLLWSAVHGMVDTRLVEISNTYNTPISGRGTLVLQLEAMAAEGDGPVSYFRDAVQLEGTIFNQIYDIWFTDRFFDFGNYDQTEEFLLDRRLVFLYELLVPWSSYTAKSIPANIWTPIVTVVIVYDMGGVSADFTRPLEPEFVVQDIFGNNLSGIQTNELLDIPLPVEMSSFSALYNPVKRNDGVFVRWVTESETDNYAFVLYRSTGPDTPKESVARVQGQGSSEGRHVYEVFDDRADVQNTSDLVYYLEQIDMNGKTTSYGPVDVKSISLPSQLRLAKNYPNPFNPGTTIEFDLPASSPVVVSVYDITGKKIATLLDGSLSAGTHQTHWSGRNDDGEYVGSGMYFYRLQALGQSRVGKMNLIR